MQTQEKHSQAAVLGLQHLLAMYSGSILVPIMIATALGYSTERLTYLISTEYLHVGWQPSSNSNSTNTLELDSQSFSELPFNRSLLDYDWAKPW